MWRRDTIEGELIVVSIISGCFTVLGIILLQHGWLKKFMLNWDFEKFKIKENKKAAKWKIKHQIKNPAPQNVATKVMDLIPLINKLDTDTVKTLIEKFLGPKYEYEESNLSEAIADLLGETPADAIRGFLEGMRETKKTKNKKETDNSAFFD
jgi:hypothetical protein